MSDDARRLWVMFLLALWAMAFAGAFAAWWLTPPSGDGFTRGMNRITIFLGWQGIAGMLALATWGVGRGFPKGSPARRLSRWPLALALVLVAGLVALILWARFLAG